MIITSYLLKGEFSFYHEVACKVLYLIIPTTCGVAHGCLLGKHESFSGQTEWYLKIFLTTLMPLHKSSSHYTALILIIINDKKTGCTNILYMYVSYVTTWHKIYFSTSDFLIQITIINLTYNSYNNLLLLLLIQKVIAYNSAYPQYGPNYLNVAINEDTYYAHLQLFYTRQIKCSLLFLAVNNGS